MDESQKDHGSGESWSFCVVNLASAQGGGDGVEDGIDGGGSADGLDEPVLGGEAAEAVDAGVLTSEGFGRPDFGG